MRTLPIVLVAACWSSSQPTDPPRPDAAPVTVAIASIRLADDCGGSAQLEQEKTMAGDCAGDCSFARACEQTQLQVSLRSTAGSKTKLSIKSIELLDDTGKALGRLEVRGATRWADDGSYAAWDQVVGAGEVLAASYALSAPDWGGIPGGRNPARKVRVRVTFGIGDGEKTFEKEATIAAFSDPDVVT